MCRRHFDPVWGQQCYSLTNLVDGSMHSSAIHLSCRTLHTENKCYTKFKHVHLKGPHFRVFHSWPRPCMVAREAAAISLV